jgi:CRP-like cAMP-binding protein
VGIALPRNDPPKETRMPNGPAPTTTAYAPGTFLGELPPDDLVVLESSGRRVAHAAGATLFVEGEGSGRVMIITRGRAKIFATCGNGRSVVLGIRGPGDIVGELSAVDGRPRIATATMLDGGEVLVVPAEVFHGFLDERAGVAATLVRILAVRLRDADRSRTMFGAHDCATRLAQVLLDLAERHGSAHGDATLIDIPLTQQDLADWVGASREAVTKALHSFRHAGIIETRRRAIVVHDLPALIRRAKLDADSPLTRAPCGSLA